MFNIMKNLLNDVNTNQLDNSIQKSDKDISDNIDIFKVDQGLTLDDEITEYTSLSLMNQELFNLMKEQLKEKDLQIRKLSEILSQGQDLHKNTQILSRQQHSEQDLISLEDDLDKNLKKVEINMTDHKEQKHRGFWGILFEK